MGQIDFQCACGRRLKAATGLVGKAIECSGCGVRVVVPDHSSFGDRINIGGETVSTAQWIRTKCVCGKVLKAPPKMAGSYGTCPRCSQRVKMPLPNPDDGFSGASKAGTTAFELLYEHDHNQASRMAAAGSGTKSGDTATGKALGDPSRPADMNVDTPSGGPDSHEQTQAPGANATNAGGDSSVMNLADPGARSSPDPSVRAVCACGNLVKGPAFMAGKMGKCNQCGEAVVMPLAVESDTVPPKAPDKLDTEPESNIKLPADFVLTAESKDAELKRRRKAYEVSRQKGSMGETVELGFKGMVMLPFRLISARDEMSPTAKTGVGLALFVIAAWLFIHNWPGDYVDAQHQWAVPREYYYNMSDNRLVELGDLEYQEVTRNLLATQPEAASYIVRAYVYACGSCDTAPHQVVFLERFTPEAIKATIELEHLISRGVGNTDQTRSISKMIEHGHFIGRFIDPLQGPNPKPTSASPPAAATLPSPTTQSASARTGSAVASTTSPTDATGERPVLLEKMNWLLYDANAALLSNPIPGCKDRVNRCSPEAK